MFQPMKSRQCFATVNLNWGTLQPGFFFFLQNNGGSFHTDVIAHIIVEF